MKKILYTVMALMCFVCCDKPSPTPGPEPGPSVQPEKTLAEAIDLIDEVPDELWTKVHDIVQRTGIKIIPM